MVDLHKYTYAKFSRELDATVGVLAIAAAASVYNAIVGPPQRAFIVETDVGFLYTNGIWIQHGYVAGTVHVDDFLGDFEETEIKVWDLSALWTDRGKARAPRARGN